MKQIHKGLLLAAVLFLGGQSTCSDSTKAGYLTAFKFPSWTLPAAIGGVLGIGLGGTAVWAFMKRSAQRQKEQTIAMQTSLRNAYVQQQDNVLHVCCFGNPRNDERPVNTLVLHQAFSFTNEGRLIPYQIAVSKLGTPDETEAYWTVNVNNAKIGN